MSRHRSPLTLAAAALVAAALPAAGASAMPARETSATTRTPSAQRLEAAGHAATLRAIGVRMTTASCWER